MFGRISCEAIGSWTFLCKEFFKLQILFHFRSLVCSYLFLLDSVLVGCMFLETCSFFPGCQICWIAVHSILLWILVFLQYQLLFLLLHFLFCLFESSLFSSWWAWSEVCQSCLPFQRTSSWLYWFLLFLISILFISSLIFIILPSADFRFCVFFFF